MSYIQLISLYHDATNQYVDQHVLQPRILLDLYLELMNMLKLTPPHQVQAQALAHHGQQDVVAQNSM